MKKRFFEKNEVNSDKEFGIPHCANVLYKSFYFGLKPYFEKLYINEGHLYYAELLCYDAYLKGKATLVDGLYVLPIEEVDAIVEKVYQKFGMRG